jgi:glycosyltransferase involved in cell wall biosynthesis
MNNIRLIHITTVSQTLGFLRGQVSDMKRRGFEVHAVSSPGVELGAFATREGVPVHAVRMTRRITPLRDLVALVRLFFLMVRLRPSMVHANTPKGGLLGTLAAWLARVPARVYHIRGLPLMTTSGLKRRILSWSEWISCRLAHRVLCVSHSVCEVAVAEGLCPPGKIRVLGAGSSNGVDAGGRFNPARAGEKERLRLRAELGIPSEALVVGFVGRLAAAKGITELAAAWGLLRDRFPALHLLLVGPSEPHDPLPERCAAFLRAEERVHRAGPREDIPACLAAMDLFALPSHREGFSGANLEAAAMALPVVTTDVPGCTDSIVDGVTGVLVPPRDPAALAEAIGRYLDDAELSLRHGRAGRERVLREFRPEAIWEATFQEYMSLLRERGLASPGLAVGEVRPASNSPSMAVPS